LLGDTDIICCDRPARGFRIKHDVFGIAHAWELVDRRPMRQARYEWVLRGYAISGWNVLLDRRAQSLDGRGRRAREGILPHTARQGGPCGSREDEHRGGPGQQANRSPASCIMYSVLTNSTAVMMTWY
jgi:hypothetical protein